MQINLPTNLEHSLLAEVARGHFASMDDAIAQAVRLLLQASPPEARPGSSAEEKATGPDRKPIWEVFEEISAGIPDEEWSRLPADGAEQHDHYAGRVRHPDLKALTAPKSVSRGK